MPSFLTVLETIGVISFAISGAMVAIRRELDLFGVVFMGIITAVGGGAIRDLLIGLTPPMCFRNPIYLRTAFLTSLLFFLPLCRRPLLRHHRLFDLILFLTDSLGLALFAVDGVELALEVSTEFSPDLLLFIALLTGTGGGVLRDTLLGQTPQIFVKHIYAAAVLAGAAVQLILLRCGLSRYLAMAAGAVTIFVLRWLAAKYRWNFPRATDDLDE